MGDDVMVTSLTFSPYTCPFFKFYWTYKFHLWYKHSTTSNTSNDKSASDLDKSWRSQVKVKGTMNNRWYLISIKPKDIISGTKVQYQKRHLMTSAFFTLTIGQGHTTWLKVTDVEVSAFSECFLFFGTNIQQH